MKKFLAGGALALFAFASVGVALPMVASAAPCRAIPAPGCSGTTDSPMSPKGPKSGKKEPHKAGNPSDPKTGHPPIRFR